MHLLRESLEILLAQVRTISRAPLENVRAQVRTMFRANLEIVCAQGLSFCVHP
jgi:hypothetical protein